ncbi:endonuclease/exonuclease/phosphatase family protein [Flavobacterium lacisediminis]|uniref:Endonuclease/exonuclease/phosphatase family protein n=1 Tax=Flavobacterium lacisediminis TaxID=2989705 RepID=A0ABT3EFW0_9FLAO|nr:endonuclease/exonuclease/phosphatase family protein [Flavobacterium lacisediminis]MCW1147437.1 endonuclease/exonuclease/phosphatase family protein [Flavobacterium lacisediminis]
MRKQTWLSKIMFFFNIVLAILTFLAYLLPFLAPKAFPFLSVLTLIMPLFLILNFFFFVYWLLQLKRQMLLSGILLLLGITFINRFYKFSETNLPKEDTDFKVMSYNVRLFNIYEWLPKDDVAEQISKLINEKSPDILCLQDFTTNDNVDFSRYPYSYVKLNGENLKYGQAIYSNYKIINKGEIEFPDSFNNAIFADVLKGKDTVRVYSIHLQSVKISADINEKIDEAKSKFILKRLSLAFGKQQQQSEIISEHFENCSYPKIICSDLNNSAFSYVYRTIKGDMKDAFEEAGTGFGKSYNFKYYPARIDFILVDDAIQVKQFKSIDTFFQSDHFPQITRLNLEKKEEK